MEMKVHGVRTTLLALKQLDPDVSKQVMATLKAAQELLRSRAVSNVYGPGLSGWGNWRGGYDAGTIAAGIKPTTAKSRKRGSAVSNVAGVANMSPAGAIWEVAGRKTDGKPPGVGKGGRGNGAAMIAAIRAKDGQASRTIWRAYDDGVAEETSASIIAAVEVAKETCRARLAAMSDG